MKIVAFSTPGWTGHDKEECSETGDYHEEVIIAVKVNAEIRFKVDSESAPGF